MSFCLAHVHVKDYIVSDESTGNRSEARSLGGKYLLELLPGEGQLDLGGYLGKLKATGYDGPISLEYLGDDETIIKSMQYITKLWEE
jgi:sugar phosphate isomerase/epimerase